MLESLELLLCCTLPAVEGLAVVETEAASVHYHQLVSVLCSTAGTGCGAVTGGLSSVLEGAGGTSDFSLLRRSFASNSDDFTSWFSYWFWFCRRQWLWFVCLSHWFF